MKEGWVHLWRQSIKRGWLKNHKLWTFWTYCLMKASGVEGEVLERYNRVKLKRGQFIFTYPMAQKDLCMGIQTIRTCVTKLEKWGNINRETNSQFSIITITNYESFNPPLIKINRQTNRQVTGNQQASNRQVTTYKKDKEGKESKESKEKDFVTEVFNYFLLKTKKNLTLTPPRRLIIEKRYKEGRKVEELKTAIDNFVLDDWADRPKFVDVVYCLGVRNKIDNLDRWINYKPKESMKDPPVFRGHMKD